MALELIYTSTRTVPNVSGLLTTDVAVYLPNWDAVLTRLAISSYGNLFKVFRDGTAVCIGNKMNTLVHGSLVGGGGVALIPVPGGYDAYELDPIAGQPDFARKLNGAVLDGNFILQGILFDPAQGLLYNRGAAGRTVERRRLSDGEVVSSFPIETDTQVTYHAYQYAGVGRGVAVSYDSPGRVVFFDFNAGEIILASELGLGARIIAYDHLHRLVIAVLPDGHVKVFTSEALPATLSPPELIPATAGKLKGNALTTRLTGSRGEPIGDAWVKWRLAGDKGSLEKPYTRTDANGYAVNYYYGPETDLGLGQETVMVEVVV